MRWHENKPKPSYIEYARLINEFQKFKELWDKSGAVAHRCFINTYGFNPCVSTVAQPSQSVPSNTTKRGENI